MFGVDQQKLKSIIQKTKEKRKVKLKYRSTSRYFVEYPKNVKAIDYFPSRGTKTLESINEKFFENDDNCESSKVKDNSIERNTHESQPNNNPRDIVLNNLSN